jgi:hypothetical protein
MKLFSLLETQYYNFANAAKNYLSKTLSNYGEAYGNSTIFGQLINVLNGVVQNMMMYIEDALTEQNKWTAQRKKSIYGLASQSGYEPSYGYATGVQLKLAFTPSSTQALDVIIKNHEQLTCTQNGLVYNVILPQEAIVLNIQKDNASKYLYAVEGRFESQTFLSEGGKYWTRNFQFVGNVDVNYITVEVNDEPWEYVPSLYDMVADGKQFTYKVGYSGGIDLIFGNDYHGRSLKNNDVVKVTYLIHSGESGNVDPHTETYFVFNNSLGDINGNTVDGNAIFSITFSTPDGVTSGTNSEDLDSVRNNIGYNSRSLVLSSPENYKEYLSKFSFVGYNRSWSEPGSMVVNTLAMKNYKLNLDNGLDYFKLSEKDLLLSDVQKQSIINSLQNSGRQLAGVTYNIIDPEIYKYMLTVYIKLKSTKYDRAYIESKIRVLIGEFFTDITSDQFIPKSDIEKLILDNVEGVDGVNCYFLSEKNETALQTKQYDINEYKWNPAKGKYDIEKKTVYLYNDENPGLGLDAHGNIELTSDHQFPVLMGGWDWLNDSDPEQQEVTVVDPLNIIFE